MWKTRGNMGHPIFLNRLSGRSYTFNWPPVLRSNGQGQVATKDPAATGEGVHACVMLGYLRRFPCLQLWLPELQPGLPAGWGWSPCLGRRPGTQGAWKGEGRGNPAQGILHFSYHTHEATELVPWGFEHAAEFWMEKSEALSISF